jgi:putative inorganic carbon (HCO3(-)) transporter
MITLRHKPGQLLGFTLPPPRPRQLLWLTGLVGLGLIIAWLPLSQAILVLGGTGLLTLLLIWPNLSVFLLIPIIPFSPLVATTIGGVKIGLMEIVLFLGVVAWLLKLATTQTELRRQLMGQPAFGSRPVLLLPFLVFLAGVSLSWLTALSIGASLVETLKWVEMLALYLLIVALLPARHLTWAVAVILLTGIAQATLGLYQFIFKVGPEGFLLFGGRFLRAYGTFAQPNPYGGYLGLILPLGLALTLWAWFDFRSRRRLTAASLVFLLGVSLSLSILLAALFVSQSRSAWLGFGLSSLVILAIYNKKTAVALATAVLAGTLIVLAGAFDVGGASVNATYGVIIQRLVEARSIFTLTDVAGIEVTDANFAIIDRLAHWQAAANMWRDHPWLGVGFGNYAVVYPAYAVGRWLDSLGHAHNYLLNLGAETGLIGIIVYLIFWIFAFGVLWRAMHRATGLHRAVAVGAIGTFVHLHVHNFFDNLYVQGMYLHLAILLALISIIYQGNQLEKVV